MKMESLTTQITMLILMMIHLLIFPTSSLPSRSFEAALCLPSFDTFCHQLHHSDDNHDTDDDHDSDNDHDLDDDHDSDSTPFSQMIPMRTLGVMIMMMLSKGMRVIATSSFCCSTTLATVFVWLSATSTVAVIATLSQTQRKRKPNVPFSEFSKTMVPFVCHQRLVV